MAKESINSRNLFSKFSFFQYYKNPEKLNKAYTTAWPIIEDDSQSPTYWRDTLNALGFVRILVVDQGFYFSSAGAAAPCNPAYIELLTRELIV